MKKDPIAHWEQEGDLERMKIFFKSFEPDPEQKERIKQLAINKIKEAEESTTAVNSPREILLAENSGLEKEGIKERINRNLRSFWWRWQNKLVIPAVAVIFLAFIGIGMELSKDFPLTNQLFEAKSADSARDMDTAAGSEEGYWGIASNEAPSRVSVNSMESGVASPEMAMDGNYLRNSGMPGIDPIAPGPDKAPPADETLPKKITYHLDADLQVDDVDLALNLLSEKVNSLGGYIVESSQSHNKNNSTAHAVYKIPTNQLEGFKNNLSAFGKVLYERTSSNDITDGYYDAQARLKNLESQEQRYLEILQKANTVEEILHIESYLSSVRMQIEQLKGQLKLWDHQVAYSTLTIDIQTTPNPVSVDEPWQPISWAQTWQGAKNAVLKTLSSTWNGLNYLVVGIAYALPYILIGGVLIGIYKVVKVRRRK